LGNELIQKSKKMEETYHIRIKKDYATDIIKDLQKMKALEVLHDDIPEWHFAIVNERLAEYYKNPSIAEDTDTAMDEIEKEL